LPVLPRRRGGTIWLEREWKANRLTFGERWRIEEWIGWVAYSAVYAVVMLIAAVFGNFGAALQALVIAALVVGLL
jgi:hypothetical protein